MNSHETARWYIKESGGDLAAFDAALARRAETGAPRYGQAFFNALNARDAKLIRGQLLDPFYSDTPFFAWQAVEWLTDRAGK
jgi:hypothetical protein